MRKQNLLTVIFTSSAMFFLILDSRTAISGAREGIELCLQSVIPSLFPFMTMSIIMTNAFKDTSAGLIHKYINIPKGTEGILLSGLFGGYPVGAQSLGNAYSSKGLSKKDAEYMLSFCNQAGPSFIFGIVAAQFADVRFAWALWFIQIASALLVFASQKHDCGVFTCDQSNHSASLPAAFKTGITAMGSICGWVVLFRVMLSIADKYFLRILSQCIKPLFYGFWELTNGLFTLSEIQCAELRFIEAAILLSQGGLCVTMQTASVLQGLSLRPYLKGKLLQTFYSLLLSLAVIQILPQSSNQSIYLAFILFLTAIILPYIIRKAQKTVAHKKGMVYNRSNNRKKDTVCCLERKSNVPAPTANMALN